MIHKLWQEKLELNYSDKLFDIVQFGSSVIEDKKFNDIDIAVIFEKISLKQQLDESQKIKRQLEKFVKVQIHIKSFDLYSFFEKGNFAKENILFYGKSLITNKLFAKKFSLNPKLQISYDLSKLKKKDKVRFHYMLQGKNKKYGLLRKFNGELLKPGLIEIMPEYELIFVENIKKIIAEFEIIKIFKMDN